MSKRGLICTGTESIEDLLYLRFCIPSENIESLREKSSTATELSDFIVSPFIGLASRGSLRGGIDQLEKEIDPESALEAISDKTQKAKELEESFLSSEYLQQGLSPLSKLYTLRRPGEVLAFLRNNISLLFFVMKAHKKIKEYFPAEDLILDVFSDPESYSEQELIIFIHTDLSPDQAYEKLTMLDKNWWLDACLEVGEKLSIHVEFE